MSGQHKARIGTVHCPYSTGPNGLRIAVKLVSSVTSMTLVTLLKLVTLLTLLALVTLVKRVTLVISVTPGQNNNGIQTVNFPPYSVLHTLSPQAIIVSV